MPTQLRPPRYLRTEYQVDPFGLDETEPRFSFLVDDDRRGARGTGYQIVVASTRERLEANECDLWDSGKVAASDTAHIVYAGAPLHSFTAAHWRVRIWDADGSPTPWSEPALFELGPLTARDWEGAKLIRSEVVGSAHIGAPSPYMRRTFTIQAPPTRARLYITALGLYEASINGRLVTDAVYRPGWTDYHKRVPYQAYDVTGLLVPGDNVIGAILGDGWYAGFVTRRRQNWGDRPQLILKLVIEFDEGVPALVIGSDEEWTTSTGPIRLADNYDGETYDARLEMPGWDTPHFNDSSWEAVEVVADPNNWGRREIVATIAPPVRRTEEINPVTVTQRGAEVTLFDLGQNMVGWARLRVTAPAGTEISLRFAEMLDEEGSLYTDNLHTAKATDRYICKGGGEEVYEPRFTFHGFRYVEVTTVQGLDIDSVTGIVVHSDAPIAGHFSCSNPMINKLHRNIQWSQRGNFLDVPTDCPQRAERLGWTGDIQVFARTSTFNMDVASFLSKYTVDLRDGQFTGGIERGTFPWVVPSINAQAGGPAWADAGIIVPWVVYERYGDTLVLERHYRSILDYIDFLDRVERGLVESTFQGFGDWLAVDDELIHVDDMGTQYVHAFGGTPRDYLWRAFDVHSTELARRIASVLGQDEDAERLADRRDAVRRRFTTRYVGADGQLIVTTQTAYLLALRLDLLVDEEHRHAAAEGLVASIESAGHLQTGFVGTPHLLHALRDIGRTDLAYLLLERTELPGWLYQVEQGATTIWERWDGWTPSDGLKDHEMNSFNHYAYGAVGEWLFRAIAGIDTDLDGAGYERILIRPELGGTLTSAQAHLDTIRGRIATAWELNGDVATLSLTLPPNTTAVLRLPARSTSDVSENGIAISDVDGMDDVCVRLGRVECQVGAGLYDFTIANPVISAWAGR